LEISVLKNRNFGVFLRWIFGKLLSFSKKLSTEFFVFFRFFFGGFKKVCTFAK